MSAMVTVYQRLASAWAVFFGKYGAVTEQASARGQSRQTLYREASQTIEALGGEKSRARIRELENQVAELTIRLHEMEDKLSDAVHMTPDLQAQYASTAQALGVSLSAARQLLVVFLKEQTPSVTTLGRQTRAVGQKAAEVLQVLDQLVRPQIEQATADEIFLASVQR
jgi:hypothetical protein